ncbi:hypothetical protein ACRXB1_21440, partial [Caballeronia sp. M23-90]
DKSMPPVMITNPSPIANNPNKPMRFAVFERFAGEMKRGLMIACAPEELPAFGQLIGAAFEDIEDRNFFCHDYLLSCILSN